MESSAGIGPYPGFMLVLFLFFVAGMLIYSGLFRYILDVEHEMQLVFCLGLVIIFSNLAIILFGPVSRLMSVDWLEHVIYLGNIVTVTAKLIGAAVSIGFVIIIHLFLTKTETGKAIRACGDNRKGAKLVGLNVEKMYMIALGISFTCSAVAGLALVPLVAIYPALGFEYAVLAVLVAVLGGAGNMTGALFAGFIMGLLLSFQQIFYDFSLANALLYASMIIILMLKPSGIFGTKEA
jgi:branched-chain amino acid transport system permease protein